jgi:hypothetical protein
MFGTICLRDGHNASSYYYSDLTSDVGCVCEADACMLRDMSSMSSELDDLQDGREDGGGLKSTCVG